MARHDPPIDRSIARLAGKLSGCEGKVQYMSKGAALTVLRRMESRPKTRRQPHNLEAYRCPFCRAFHIGNH